MSVLRNGTGFVPKADTVIEAGDEVLAVLNPGDEPAVCELFGAYRGRQRRPSGTRRLAQLAAPRSSAPRGVPNPSREDAKRPHSRVPARRRPRAGAGGLRGDEATRPRG